jgi:hypothetical protein
VRRPSMGNPSRDSSRVERFAWSTYRGKIPQAADLLKYVGDSVLEASSVRHQVGVVCEQSSMGGPFDRENRA